MKRLILTTALVLASAAGASAMTSATELPATVESQVRFHANGADIDNLSKRQVLALTDAINAGESARETGASVRSILNWE